MKYKVFIYTLLPFVCIFNLLQNKMAHLLLTENCDRKCISKQELIKMAKSAANGPAIVNSDSSYYSF